MGAFTALEPQSQGYVSTLLSGKGTPIITMLILPT